MCYDEYSFGFMKWTLLHYASSLLAAAGDDLETERVHTCRRASVCAHIFNFDVIRNL